MCVAVNVGVLINLQICITKNTNICLLKDIDFDSLFSLTKALGLMN